MRKIPMRKCVVTQERFPKKDLIRVVRTPEQTIEIDLTGKKNGHGAYISKSLETLALAKKNKVIAAILALLFGGLGLHKFYLGKILWGVIYLLFCWTGIPSIVGLVEGIIYLFTSDEDFKHKYG